ncbi:hypothetical protein GGR57DRAFT_177994 [Xylariaceae sp. FL1272]|nr:hypothetical protein GGR57DRAFT_177994 [Xylariaceae sp. FL1272]
MDPLSAIGATASVIQVVEVAAEAAAAAWRLTQSIINAPAEIARLAEKLERLRLLIEQTQKQRLDRQAIELDDLFPPSYRNLLYGFLERNVDALESLKSLHAASAGSSITIRGRLRWVAVDKRKTKAILEDLRDAESSLDVALSMVTMRIASLNHISLAALKSSQDVFFPQLMRGFEDVKQCVNEQISEVKKQIAFDATPSVTDVEEGVEEAENVFKQHLGVTQKRDEVNRGVPNTKTPVQLGSTPAACSTDEWFIPSHLLSNYDSSKPFARARSSPNVSYQLLKYEMGRVRKQASWTLGSFGYFYAPENVKPLTGASITATSTHNRRKVRLILRAGLRLMQQHIVHFEFTIGQNARHWMSMPWLGCSISTLNVRPTHAPIFRACFEWDLESVRYLIDSGQASIYDVDAEFHCGLLEHVFREIKDGQPYDHTLVDDFEGHQLIDYLLDCGYDPNTFYGHWCTPAVFNAFCRFDLEALDLLVRRGAKIDSFDINFAAEMTFFDSQYFRQIGFLQSVGFIDWKKEGDNRLLQAALYCRDWDTFLFALEVLKYDPNAINTASPYDDDSLPLHWVVDEDDRVAYAAALIEYGAHVDGGAASRDGPALPRCLQASCHHDMIHCLLFYGADVNCSDKYSTTPWYMLWQIITWSLMFNFVDLELLLTHLLLHGADPFQPATCAEDMDDSVFDGILARRPWYFHLSQIKSPEFARAWSFHDEIGTAYRREESGKVIQVKYNVLRPDYEAFEKDRQPRLAFSWLPDGLVRRIIGEDMKYLYSDKPEPVKGTGRGDWEPWDRIFDRQDLYEEDFTGTKPEAILYARDEHSLFYETISTPEGRDQLSTFPAVRLLYNALRRAGYRAEMDSEYDIWYEDDDGDAYYDAFESQRDLENNSPTAGCFICQDMAKYGLGHIVDQMQEGKERVRKYKEEVKAGRKKWSM